MERLKTQVESIQDQLRYDLKLLLNSGSDGLMENTNCDVRYPDMRYEDAGNGHVCQFLLFI